MSKVTVHKAYVRVDQSILFYLPYILIYLKNSNKKYDILELCFYFVFIFDKNYSGFINDLSLKSNYIKKLREEHYFKMRNKDNFLEIYYSHFLKLLTICMEKNLIEVNDEFVVLTDYGVELAKKYERKISVYPFNCSINILVRNVKTLAKINDNTKLINVLEKLGVHSL